MNQIINNLPQILEFAKEYGLPATKKRGIIREYLQSWAISQLYSHKQANMLAFVGGTSLRLLRNLPRFSEDLDFDNLGLTRDEIKGLISMLVKSFQIQNVEIELHTKLADTKTYFELKFPKLLFELGLTTDVREKLMIKIDYTSFWSGQKTEAKLFNRYGFMERIVTNNIDCVLVQKIAAYVNRKQTQPRDIFDIVWLYGQGARFDHEFAQINHHEHLISQAKKKLTQEKITGLFKQRLSPFLFTQSELNKIDFLGDVLSSLK